MLETLLGGGLPLAVSIPIIKNKTRNCHMGMVCVWIGVFLSARVWLCVLSLAVGAGCSVGTTTCPFSGTTQFS